jgi:hypothetical protein
MATFYRPFHRITQTDPPTREDFMSNEAKGIPLTGNDFDRSRLNDGISVFNTEQQARKRALFYPNLGAYIARLEIPEGAPVRIERTLSTPGHHTIWGDPDDLLMYVVSVVPV